MRFGLLFWFFGSLRTALQVAGDQVFIDNPRIAQSSLGVHRQATSKVGMTGCADNYCFRSRGGGCRKEGHASRFPDRLCVSIAAARDAIEAVNLAVCMYVCTYVRMHEGQTPHTAGCTGSFPGRSIDSVISQCGETEECNQNVNLSSRV